ncbi:histidinol dehydrogenase, partial [bacterium]|nr:histidinol dehydrogenase [bacterium]
MTKLIKIVMAPKFLQQWNDGSASAPVDAQTLSAAMQIVHDVRDNRESAIRRYAEQFNERKPDEPIRFGIEQMREAYERLRESDQQLLERVTARIRLFAQSQLDCLRPLDCEVPGGRAGHSIEPIERVGCYAPGGRYPLPSTVLMTTVTA